MKKSRHPGIAFSEIELLEISYETNLKFNSKLEMPEIELSYDYSIKDSENDKFDEKTHKKSLISVLQIELFKSKRKRPFKMSATFRAVFHSGSDESYPLENFAELQAPSYILAYARELISNITSRGIYPTLKIPPINLYMALEESKSRKNINS